MSSLSLSKMLTGRVLAADPSKLENWVPPFFKFAKGLLAYRQGRFSESADIMKGDAAGAFIQLPGLVLAMDQFYMGQKSEARKSFDKALRNPIGNRPKLISANPGLITSFDARRDGLSSRSRCRNTAADGQTRSTFATRSAGRFFCSPWRRRFTEEMIRRWSNHSALPRPFDSSEPSSHELLPDPRPARPRTRRSETRISIDGAVSFVHKDARRTESPAYFAQKSCVFRITIKRPISGEGTASSLTAVAVVITYGAEPIPADPVDR